MFFLKNSPEDLFLNFNDVLSHCTRSHVTSEGTVSSSSLDE